MNYVLWKDKEILQVNISNLFIQSDRIIELSPADPDHKLTEYFYKWMSSQEINEIIISSHDENNSTHYYINGSTPISLFSDTKGLLMTCKFKISKLEEISRKMKIHNILNECTKKI